MTLPRLLVALMLLPATAAAQHDGAREGLVITPRWFGEEVAESRHTGRLAQAADDAPRTDGPNVSVHVYGGWRQLWGGDVNEAAANDLQSQMSLWHGALVPLQDGDAPATHRGPEYGADVTVHLTPRFGLVGGVGWIESSSAGRPIEALHRTSLRPMRQSADLTMRSVPVRFGARYTHPISQRLSLVADGGAGLYFTNLQRSRRVEVDVRSYSAESISDVRGYDIGFHGGVSLDVSVSDGIGLVFGVQGVHANIGGLDGHRDTTSISYDFPEENRRTDGTLGVFELDDSITPILGLVEDEPLLDLLLFPIVIRSVKEASVGLGGLRYTIGLRVSF